MKNIDYIREEIREFSKANEFLSYREVDELQNVLYEDETILNITTGGIDRYKGLFLLTDDRALFIYHNEINQPKVLEVPYEKLEYIHMKQGNYYVSMELFFAGTKIEISDLPPDDADSFKQDLTFQVDFYDKMMKNGIPQKKKFRLLRLLLFIGIAVLTGYLVGPQFHVVEVYDEVLTDALPIEEAEESYQLEFTEMEINKDEYETTVRGIIKNLSDKEYRYISVDIQFYDKKGSIVDSQIQSIYDLKPGKSWNLDSYTISEYADTFEVVGVYAEMAE
ncbi:FxLYD domain-containing protein [Metabacillus halosaccharovorans]|uniref:FxLYD domain-containing protein n=1 Tax=Metabacillus halosaccharovorans TaxID=930124 RepID=A0ABT3DE84_9BACI|nr:FxLYD domain-containing protein [Metabacillus halosaccharovorans]MCV9885378.1 FxLYD domain-containing protein [Metabacillus halosaccharovorans]